VVTFGFTKENWNFVALAFVEEADAIMRASAFTRAIAPESPMPRLLPILLAAAFAAAPLAAVAQTGALNVEIDRSARVQLSGPASSVIVGNPAIADVTVVDANTLFIVGKGYGVTEVVAVDGLGRTLFQREIVVSGGSTGTVRVWRGAQATEMACGSSCAPSVRKSQGAAPAVAP
jgi:Flp pilus assembly secretin CpaC